MAIYHLSVKAVSRSTGRSATAAAAYRAGCEIADERTGVIHDYRRKGGVESAGLVLPAGAPEWAADRGALWNAAEQAEARKNSTVAREFEIALPAELSSVEQERLAHDFAREIVERHGCAADVAIHAPGKEGDNRNHHAHILLSTRRLTPEGFAEKTRELDDAKTGEVTRWRERFAELQNERLRENGIEARVDHRSLEAQGIDREPTLHLGPTASAIERRTGEPSRKRLDYEAEVFERLARAKEAGDLERQASEIGKSILDLSGDLAAAKAEQELAKQRRHLEEFTRLVQAGEDIGPIRRALEGVGLKWRSDDPKKWDVPEALHEAFDALAGAIKARAAGQAKQRESAIAELLSGLDPSNSGALKDRVDGLKKNAQKPTFSELVQAQEQGRQAWEQQQRGEGSDWAKKADELGGWEKALKAWKQGQRDNASGVLAWMPARQEAAKSYAQDIARWEAKLAERDAAGIEAGKALEAQRKQVSDAWQRLEPYVEAAQERFNALHEENRLKTAQNALKEREERMAKKRIEREIKIAQQAKEAAEREVERARGEGGLSRWDATESFEEGRKAERQRAEAARSTLTPREERKPEVSKEQEPEIDDGMDFGL